VRTGVISRAGQSIVCLPGRIVVTLVGAQMDFDVIAG
ncbi:MAG: NusG domain II-containing protein, partial [Oscillospiraceae bacterium]|nr:NusG domain II-containing protein [Oscillospiraceae bacterium]